jgi:hypothetical protein
MNLLIPVIILIILILIIITLDPNKYCEYEEPFNVIKSEDFKVPKIIWTYWDTNVIPEIVKLCQMNWKKFAPNYQINLVTKETAENWVQMPLNWKLLPPYRQSDIFRLLALAKYGGIWMDASTILLKNPDSFISPNNITLFTTPSSSPKNPVFENWFISAPPQNYLMKLWSDETILALQNKRQYTNNSSQHNKSAVGNYNYLICHLVLKNIQDKHKNLFDNIKIYDSNKTSFYYHDKYNWKNLSVNLLKDNYDPETLMVKFRGSDRRNMNINDFRKKIMDYI